MVWKGKRASGQDEQKPPVVVVKTRSTAAAAKAPAKSPRLPVSEKAPRPASKPGARVQPPPVTQKSGTQPKAASARTATPKIAVVRAAGARGKKDALPPSTLPPIMEGEHPQNLEIVLGIDFGTRFTKACYNILNKDVRRVVINPADANRTGLFNSTVYLDGDGRIYGSQETEVQKRRREIGYLKMLVCNPSLGYTLGLEDLVSNDPTAIDALAAFYLRYVIKVMRSLIMVQEKIRVGVTVAWSTCISIPAQYLTKRDQDRFMAIVDVAQKWSLMPDIKDGVKWTDLRSYYVRDRGTRRRNDAAVIPEIVAGMHHLIRSTDVPEGLHGFIDIGGGTVDGAIFRLLSGPQGREINILSAKVASLGSAIISQKALTNVHRRAEGLLIGAQGDKQVELNFDSFAADLRKYSHALLGEAALKCYDGILDDNPDLVSLGTRPQGSRRSFQIHTTGGGANSTWYKENLYQAERNLNRERYKAMGFEITTLPAPAGFHDGHLQFGRFVVAWNLATRPEVLKQLITRLPEELGQAGHMPVREFEPVDFRAIS